MRNTKVLVKQDEKEPIMAEVLAAEIIAISAGIKNLRNGRLNDRALFLLIQHAAPQTGAKFNKKPLSMSAIKAVFDGIESLEHEYLKKTGFQFHPVPASPDR